MAYLTSESGPCESLAQDYRGLHAGTVMREWQAVVKSLPTKADALSLPYTPCCAVSKV